MPKTRFIKQKYQRKQSNPFIIQSGQFKNGKLEPLYRPEWPEGAYISDAREKETVGHNFNFSKIPILGFVFALFLSMLLARTAWLQIGRGDYYYRMAEGNRVRIERLEPKRGVIC